jgi:hypothetical protein
MKYLIGIVVVILVAASIFADYKWKQWMAARRENRDR